VAREAAEPAEIEVERVVQAGGRSRGDAVDLDSEAAALELAGERAQELVAAAPRPGHELVEEGEVGATAARGDPVGLGADAATGGSVSAARFGGRRPRPAARSADATRRNDT